MSDTPQPGLLEKRVGTNGVEFELNESTNTLAITIKNRRFELVYDKAQEKWTAKDANYLLHKAVGEFNLHCDAPQLLATLRHVALQIV